MLSRVRPAVHLDQGLTVAEVGAIQGKQGTGSL